MVQTVLALMMPSVFLLYVSLTIFAAFIVCRLLHEVGVNVATSYLYGCRKLYFVFKLLWANITVSYFITGLFHLQYMCSHFGVVVVNIDDISSHTACYVLFCHRAPHLSHEHSTPTCGLWHRCSSSWKAGTSVGHSSLDTGVLSTSVHQELIRRMWRWKLQVLEANANLIKPVSLLQCYSIYGLPFNSVYLWNLKYRQHITFKNILPIDNSPLSSQQTL